MEGVRRLHEAARIQKKGQETERTEGSLALALAPALGAGAWRLALGAVVYYYLC